MEAGRHDLGSSANQLNEEVEHDIHLESIGQRNVLQGGHEVMPLVATCVGQLLADV